MSSSNRILDVANSGLQISRSSIDRTAHNIANVNTKGYSRQRLEQEARVLSSPGSGGVGSGVFGRGTARATEDYLNRRLEKEQSNLGYVEERSTFLSQSEQIFNESDRKGVNMLVTELFNEFRKLSVDPENVAVRASVREATRMLAVDVKRVNDGLQEIQNNIDSRIKGYVEEFNALLYEVRELNSLLVEGNSLGRSTPDLEDKRDVAMRRLGEMAEISAFKDKRGMVTISVAGKGAVVSGKTVHELEVRRTPGDGAGKLDNSLSIYLKDSTPFDLTPYLGKGRLSALVRVRDQDLGASRRAMSNIFFNMVKDVNALHREGYGADGVSGRDFFQPISESDRERSLELFRLSDAVSNSLDSIAAGRIPNAPADNRTALAIANLSSRKGLSDGEERSLIEQYSAVVSGLGTAASYANRELDFQRDVLGQLDAFREQLSGVNLDEEAANLVRFQHAYSANAKVMQVADEILETVITALT